MSYYVIEITRSRKGIEKSIEIESRETIDYVFSCKYIRRGDYERVRIEVLKDWTQIWIDRLIVLDALIKSYREYGLDKDLFLKEVRLSTSEEAFKMLEPFLAHVMADPEKYIPIDTLPLKFINIMSNWIYELVRIPTVIEVKAQEYPTHLEGIASIKVWGKY